MIIMKLKERIKSLNDNLKEEKIKKELEEIETINIELDHRVTKLVTENEHLKQTYNQLYDSIKSSQLLRIDVAPLAPKLRNNRTTHYDYLKHTQEETTTLREIVENARLINPLNTSLDYTFKDPWSKDLSCGIRAIWRTLLKKTTFLHTRLTFSISMDSLSPQVVSAAKLPILNPNEFDLWKMRIEQYFLMTDYSLWEVILNGDSPVPTRVIEGVAQPVAPTTAEQRLARKNELKARGTLLMALPDKHQLKFNSHKDAKILMEAIEKRFGGNTETKKVQKTLLKQQFENFTSSSSEGLDQIHDRLQKLADLEAQSLDDLFNSLKIYENEVKHSSSTRTTLPNLDFVSSSHTDSTTDSVSAAASVSAVCAKLHIDVDDLEEMDLRWQMAMLTMQTRRFLQKTGRNLGANGPTSMGFDMSKVECYNCNRNGHFAWECRSPKDFRRTGVVELQRRTVPVETSTSNALFSQCDESVEARLLVYKQNESVFEENIKLLNIKVQLRDTVVVTLRLKLEKAEKERDDLKVKLEKFQTSSKNLSELLASQTKSDCDSWPPSSLYDRFQHSGRYHAILPPYTGTFMPPKPNLVFHTARTTVETDHFAFNVLLSPEQDLSHTTRLIVPIIEDWVSDSENESKTKAPQFVPSFAQSSAHVKSLGQSVQPIETTILAATLVPASPKSNSSGKRRNRKAYFVYKSVDHLIKDCDLHTKIMAQPIHRNYAHRGHHKQPVSAAMPKINVTRPTHAHPTVTKSKSPIKRHITRSPSPKISNSPPRVTAVKAHVVSAAQGKQGKWGNPQHALKDKGVIDSGCSRHMTWNMSYLSEFEGLNGGYVAFGDNPKGGKITGKGKIKTGKLDFDDVYFVKELKFNLFSVLQMCDKKNSVLFTDTKCLVLSPDFKLPDESQVLLRVSRENNMYNVNLNNIVPSGDLTCLFAKATINESNLWHRRTPSIGFMRPFGCPVTILNTLDSLGKFKGKVYKGFLVGYFVPSKAFRVFNSRTRFCSRDLACEFSRNKPTITCIGPTWLFYIDSLTRTMNYQPIVAGNQTNSSAGFQDKFAAEKAGEEIKQQYVLFPMWSSVSINPQNYDGDAAFDGKEHDVDVKKPESEVNVSSRSSAQSRKQDDKTKKEDKGKSPVESFTWYTDLNAEFEDCSDNSSNEVNAASSIVPTVGQNSLNSTNTFSAAELEDIAYSDDEDVVGAEADFNNLESSISVSPIPTTRIHKDHHEEPKRVHQALKDLSWIEAMQEELLQFKMQKFWVLVDLLHGKRAIGTK
nr:hypothetical protein [Tanacetum cinerariifolium]